MDALVDATTGQMKPGCHEHQDDHLGKWILKAMEESGDRTHQIDSASGATETRASFKLRTVRMAQALLARGLNVGDVILACADNHMDATVPTVASQYIGLTPVNVAVGTSQDDMKHILSLAKPKIIFSDKQMVPVLKNMINSMAIKADMVVFDDDYQDSTVQKFSDYQKPTGTEKDFRCIDFDPATTTAFSLCSSGTTGLIKLVAVSHANFVVAWLVVLCLDPETRIIGFEDSLYLSFSPLMWVSGIFHMMGSCLFGYARLQVKEPFTVELAKDLIERYKPNTILLPPYFMFALTKTSIKINFSSLRHIYTGGDIVNQEVFRTMQNLCPKAKLIVMYGCSELGLVTSNYGFYRGSIGRMYQWVKWKIMNEKEVSYGETGELCVKTPKMFLHYHNNPKGTEKAFDDEGFYMTGDIAYQDSDGYIYIVDRLKGSIRYREFDVNRGPIESVINNIKGVFLTAVVGLPDLSEGELPAALVQLTPDSKVTEQQIIDKVKESLTDQEQLRGGVVIIDRLPLTLTGKIDRKTINQMKYKLFNNPTTIDKSTSQAQIR